jgi:hypothetical protein
MRDDESTPSFPLDEKTRFSPSLDLLIAKRGLDYAKSLSATQRFNGQKQLPAEVKR